MKKGFWVKAAFCGGLAVMPLVVSATGPSLLSLTDRSLRVVVVTTSRWSDKDILQIADLPDDYAKSHAIITSPRLLGIVVGACQTALSYDIKSFPWSHMKRTIEGSRPEFDEGMRIGRGITVAADPAPFGGSKTCNQGGYYLQKWTGLESKRQHFAEQSTIADAVLKDEVNNHTRNE